ncbi:MAG: hypothetical protein KKF89_04920 [Nanoarchaeota archaeon]|nr:hypothetical protein [Nanoarchaeota archaeon]
MNIFFELNNVSQKYKASSAGVAVNDYRFGNMSKEDLLTYSKIGLNQDIKDIFSEDEQSMIRDLSLENDIESIKQAYFLVTDKALGIDRQFRNNILQMFGFNPININSVRNQFTPNESIDAIYCMQDKHVNSIKNVYNDQHIELPDILTTLTETDIKDPYGYGIEKHIETTKNIWHGVQERVVEILDMYE